MEQEVRNPEHFTKDSVETVPQDMEVLQTEGLPALEELPGTKERFYGVSSRIPRNRGLQSRSFETAS
jgi:hypothetical protein